MAIAPPKSTPLLINGRVSEPWLAFFASLAGGVFTASQVQANDVVMSFPANLNPIVTHSGQLLILALSQAAIDLWNTSPGAVTPAGGSHWRIFADDVGGGGGQLTFGFFDVPNNRIAGGFDNSGWLQVTNGLTAPNAANISIGSDWTQYAPAIQAAAGGMAATITANWDCSYYRIGKLCFVKFNLQVALGGSSGNWFNINLPFNNGAANGVSAGNVFLSFGDSGSWVNGYLYCGSNVFTVALEQYAFMPLGTLYIQGQFFYQTT